MKEGPTSRNVFEMAETVLDDLVKKCLANEGQGKKGNRCTAVPFAPGIGEVVQKRCRYHRGPLIEHEGEQYLPCTYEKTDS